MQKRVQVKTILFALIAAGTLTIPAVAQMLTPAAVVQLGQQKGAYGHSGFSWIPKTHTLVYSQTTNVRDGSWIYELQIPSKTPQRIIQGEKPVPSPAGRELAFLRPSAAIDQTTPYRTGRQIWVCGIDGSNARQLTNIPGGVFDMSPLVWSPDGRNILYITFIFETHPPVAKPTVAMPTVDVYPQPATIPYSYALHAIDVTSGTDRIVVQHKGGMGSLFAWLDNSTILYEHDNGMTAEHTRSMLATISLDGTHLRTVVSGYQWQTLYEPVLNDQRDVVAFRADPHQETAYPSRNEIALANVQSGHTRLLSFTRNASAAESMAWSPDGKRLIYSDGPSTRFELFATSGTKPVQLTFGDGKNINPAFSDDQRYIAWEREDATTAASLWVGTWKNGRIFAGQNVMQLTQPLAGVTTGATTAIRWKSFDGRMIDGYLTLPVNRHGGNYPLVVILHGGPTGQVTLDDVAWPGGLYFVELLAQRGYAVFQPDYRASGNFGYDLIVQERNRRTLFAEDFADISSGIAMLEKRHIADRSKLYLLGHSYGSMETNWIITHDSRFRAAISYEGGDIFYDWSAGPGIGHASIGPNKSLEWKVDSTPLTDPAAWKANSAVLAASNVRTPTLFINAEYGGNFPSMTWLFGALQSKGIDTQYLFYHNEPHVVSQPINQLDLLNRALHWIGSH